MTETPISDRLEVREHWRKTLRSRIRDWWKAEFAGKATVDLLWATARAEVELRDDPQFRAGFLEAFLHQVLYDAGVGMLSERRVIVDGQNGLGTDDEPWLEYDPTTAQYILLSEMTDDQAIAAAAFREKRINAERARMEVLMDPAKRVAVTIATHSKPREEEPPDDGWHSQDITVTTRPAPPEPEPDGAGWDGREYAGLCRHCGQYFDSKEYQRSTNFWGRTDPNHEAAYAGICRECSRLYPYALLKASADHFAYALRLRTGELIYFTDCSFSGEWVHLESDDWSFHFPKDEKYLPCNIDRGVYVRLSDIVWCVDAPEGS